MTQLFLTGKQYDWIYFTCCTKILHDQCSVLLFIRLFTFLTNNTSLALIGRNPFRACLKSIYIFFTILSLSWEPMFSADFLRLPGYSIIDRPQGTRFEIPQYLVKQMQKELFKKIRVNEQTTHHLRYLEAVQLTLTQPKINESHLALKLQLVKFSNGCNQDLQKMPK